MKETRRLLCVFILVLMVCCNTHDTKTIVKNWLGKEMLSDFTLANDSLANKIKGRFCIVSYVDSLGCVSCKLGLRKWSAFSAYVDSLIGKHVPIIFIVSESAQRDMRFSLKADHYTPDMVVVDYKDSLNKVYGFPENNELQTFLLNKEHKIVVVGNPIHNEKVLDLYVRTVVKSDGVSSKFIQNHKNTIR